MDGPPTKGELGTRERIVRAADDLFYRRGFESTSFSDIAEAVSISRGNFYYHFKSKDDILAAVVQARIAHTRQMLDEWEAEGADPRERVRLFIDILIRNQAQILKYGCPVGTLCVELAKLSHPSLLDANRHFTLFRTWLRRQFELLGHARDADRLAIQLLVRSQGAATLAHAFRDAQFLKREMSEMVAWLDGMVSCSVRRRTGTPEFQR